MSDKYDALKLDNQLCFPLDAEEAVQLYTIVRKLLKQFE